MGASQRTALFPALCCWAGCRPDIRTSCMSAPPAPRWTAPPRAPRVAAAGHARRMACMHGMCCPPRQRSGETNFCSTEKYESLSRRRARDTPPPHVPFQTKSVAEAPTARSASAITMRATMMIKSTWWRCGSSGSGSNRRHRLFWDGDSKIPILQCKIYI